MARVVKKKPYEGHEVIYRQMRREGCVVWGQKGSGSTGKSCSTENNHFLKDVLSQPWAPKDGRVIELGCGTGPILRQICKKGFTGVGIDVSKTAIAMAKEQSKGLNIKFRQADACNLNTKSLGKFDLVIDGLCLHCITAARDRKAYFDNVFRLLKEGGVFVLLTMCGPIDKKIFSQIHNGHKILKKVVYVPFEDKSYAGQVNFNCKQYLPTRYFGHWKDILTEVHSAGLETKLIRYKANNSKECNGTLSVGAIK